MTDTTPVAPARTIDSLPARFAGVLLSPYETFARLAVAPRWFDMLVLVVGISVLCTAGFMATEVGQQAALDLQVDRIEAFGQQVTDEAYARRQAAIEAYGPYLAAANLVFGVPLIALALAGILFAVFTGALGGEATFRQVFAVVVHAGAITVVQQLFVLPLNYARESMTSPTNLAVFFPMLDEAGFLARLLGTVDLFLVWWTVVLAIGLAALYRRRVRPIAAGLLAVYGIGAVILAIILSSLGGS